MKRGAGDDVPKILLLRIPWDRDLEASDLTPAGTMLTRDTRLFGHAERHLAFPVTGTFGVALGLLALRCARHGERLIPLTSAIPE
jgi:hypothetical protein